MKVKALTMPKNVELENDSLTDRYGRFVVQPLERGFGVTLGNALRRVLLSSIHGAAVTAVKIEGVQHEFSTIDGIVEDTSQIVLSLKRLRIKLLGDEPKKLHISVNKKGVVTAADITDDPEIEILNPDLHIATLTKKTKLEIEMDLTTGRGYVPVERTKRDSKPIGVVPLDAIYSPIMQVKYGTEATRVGQRTDYDRLILEVTTDGTVGPQDAVAYAAKILKDHLVQFINFDEEPVMDTEEEADEEVDRMRELLLRPVDELELSVRSANCLRMADIRTLGDLVQKPDHKMLKYRNFGRKSLVELKEIIGEYGLDFGMDVSRFLPAELIDAPYAAESEEEEEAVVNAG